MRNRGYSLAAVVLVISGIMLAPSLASAHCDTLDGPVVKDARIALEKGDVTPVLKWVKPKFEDEIRSAFKKTIAVRAKGPEAKELADMYFFETLVRIHRLGENAPYTGLKKAASVEPFIVEADNVVEGHSSEALIKELVDTVDGSLRKRIAQVLKARLESDKSVDAGRKYVEAYVSFVHYVEKLHLLSANSSDPHGHDANTKDDEE